jgi:hypothetical protein
MARQDAILLSPSAPMHLGDAHRQGGRTNPHGAG